MEMMQPGLHPGLGTPKRGLFWAPAYHDAETRPPETWGPNTCLHGACEKLLYLPGQRKILLF